MRINADSPEARMTWNALPLRRSPTGTLLVDSLESPFDGEYVFLSLEGQSFTAYWELAVDGEPTKDARAYPYAKGQWFESIAEEPLPAADYLWRPRPKGLTAQANTKTWTYPMARALLKRWQEAGNQEFGAWGFHPQSGTWVPLFYSPENDGLCLRTGTLLMEKEILTIITLPLPRRVTRPVDPSFNKTPLWG